MNYFLKGGGTVDCVFFTAVVSCSIFLTPWFIPVGVLLAWAWLHLAPTFEPRQRVAPPQSAVVLQLNPPAKMPPPQSLSRTG